MTIWTKDTTGHRLRPMGFAPAMVRALMREHNPKRQTRRVIAASTFRPWAGERDADEWPLAWTQPAAESKARPLLKRVPCKAGEVGAILCVQELLVNVDGFAVYAATGERVLQATDGEPPAPVRWRWKVHQLAPRYCPLEASRLRLLVTAIRAEHVQAITAADAELEGMDTAAPQYLGRDDEGPDEDPRQVGYNPAGASFARDNFRRYWDTLHPSPGERWDDNPGVFVVSLDEWERRAAGPKVAEPRP